MINEQYAHLYCRDEISKIENYEKAITDTSQTWDCHHRDEIKVLPSGMIVYRSKQELIENGRYFQCPANELIFLTSAEHMRLHMKGKSLSIEIRKKMSKAKSISTKLKMRKVLNERSIAYRQYKSNGGTISWNEFQRSVAKEFSC